MEIPFYTTFREFKQNYDTDFEQWKQTFPDGAESDFIGEIQSLYGAFLKTGTEIDDEVSSYWMPEDYPEYYPLSITQYADLVQEKLIDFAKINELLDYDDDDFSFSLKENIEILDFWEECNIKTKNNGAIIDDQRHKYYEEFFSSDGIKIKFDEVKYRNFKFSIWKIRDFVIDRERQLSNKTDGIPIPETESSEPKTKIQFSTPEKIALLQLTELEQRIDILTGNVSEQKYRLLSALFGVTYDTVKKTYLNGTLTPLHKKRAREFYENNFNE